mmetsp:Transcript_122318/g.346813  ORF Transcript_122318/g.346813 Transcript_122318/m.346813 type:complete len:207 (-) Transcript_122318:237-857(-)
MEVATDAEHMAENDRLRALAGGGTSLDPVMRGFQSAGFQAQTQEFVAQRAPAFTVACPDGSHPLAWTQYHAEYRAMFEAQLDATLPGLGLTKDQFHEHCAWLHEGVVALDDDSDGLYAFIDSATAAEDYGRFLQAMFAEVRRQQCQAAPAQAGAAPQTQEIEVAVPDGVGPGQMLAVDYLGTRYEVAVPEGCMPGTVFRVAVTAPA